jgi:electron transfer flavoprotein beta subunit
MTTVVCFKWVVAAPDLRVDPASGAIDVGRARREISSYDRNTLEAARLVAAAQGGRAVGLTAGAITPAGLKDALARGLDEVIHVPLDETAPVDGHVTAHLLAAAIRTIDGADLVLTTEGSADSYAHETAPRVAELLGWPVVTNAVAVDVAGGRLRATRVLDDALEVVEVTLPAVVSVVPEIAAAPIPGLSAVLAAAKKPRTELAVGSLGLPADAATPRCRAERTAGVLTARRGLRYEGSPDEIAAALVAALEQDGVLA